MTYPDPTIIEAISRRFVAVKLDLFGDRSQVRPLNVYWTPTILFGDRRGKIHYESLDFLPPADFLDLLDIGEAMVRMRWAEYEAAEELLGHIEKRRADSPFLPEAIYRQGLVFFLKSGSSATLNANAEELVERFPTSIWTSRAAYRLDKS